MQQRNDKKYRCQIALTIIFSISSSWLLSNHNLASNALEFRQHFGKFLLAKTPDERQPEAVKQAIEQIPAAQPPASVKPKQQINSPIPARVSPNTIDSPSTSQATNNSGGSRTSRAENTNPTPTPPASNSASRPNRSVDSNSRTATNRPSSPRQGGRQSVANSGTNNSSRSVIAVAPSTNFNYKDINFVDIAFGILSRGDFQSQGRYYHFYQFEGRENQLIQIRLLGSADQRRSSNLSLEPFMFLLGPDNQVVVKRGSTGTSNDAKDAFMFVRLPANGRYTIAVTSRNPGENGRYSLALRNDRASYILDESGELSAASLTLKQNSSAYNIAKFQGKKDQLVNIRVDSLYEDFSPYIVLLNSQGQRIAVDNDKDGRYSALIDRARLPQDDTYYVVVISASPQQRGKYRLTLF